MSRMRKWFKKNEKGFTLVELVVVIAILGVLAAIAVPRVMNSLDNAKTTANEANIRTIESAVTLYMADNPNVAVEDMDDIAVLTPAYLKENPEDPFTNEPDGYGITNGEAKLNTATSE